MASWDAKYEDYKLRTMFQSGKEAAEDATISAGLRLESLHRILQHTLKVNDQVDWESLKGHSTYERPTNFPEPQPVVKWMPEPLYQAPKIGNYILYLAGSICHKRRTERALDHEREYHRSDLPQRGSRRAPYHAQQVAG